LGEPTRRRPVPIRTMLAVVGSVLITVVVVEALLKLHQVVVWTLVSVFFATVLHPPVDALVRHLKLGRALAAIMVFLASTGLVAGLGYAFVRPLADQVNIAVNEFPSYVANAEAGKGTIGHLVKKYNVESYVDKNQPKLQSALKSAEKPAVKAAEGLLNTVTALAAIIVMTFLLLIEGPRMMAGGLAAMSPPTQDKVRIVLRDVVRALGGYTGGVLLTSILAGLLAYVTLWALGVPFRGVLALWVGFTALVPIAGVILGVIPAAVVGFIHSTPAGIGVVAILLTFHFIENRVLSKRINARTIALSPLGVGVSILAGLQLLGFLGVFLAIPAAGVIHVVIRDLWGFRHPPPSGVTAGGTLVGAPVGGPVGTLPVASRAGRAPVTAPVDLGS
jgi:predicted PurR-regulated permease PerM